MTASIGISIYPTDGTDASILIKNADSSMYHAKEQGGNNYQFYSPALDFKCLEQLTLGNNLHKAVEENQLLLALSAADRSLQRKNFRGGDAGPVATSGLGPHVRRKSLSPLPKI